jgi:hypothetical protein
MKSVIHYQPITRAILLVALCSTLGPAQKYSGPRPAEADIPYLQHANSLVETEAVEASEENRKDWTVYVIAGAASPARTPMAEPIFLLKSENIAPEKLELYRLELKRGSRQIAFSQKKKKKNPRPLRLSISRLAEDLYRLEANEPLENGEYSLTPAGSNQVFCFQVY